MFVNIFLLNVLAIGADQPAPPKGGVWLLGVKAYTPITEVHTFSVDLLAKSDKILASHVVPLAFNSTLVPTSRDWAQDVVNGRVVMWHTIYGGEDNGACAVETIKLPSSHTAAPKLESTWIVPEKYCVKGARIALGTKGSAVSAVYAFVRIKEEKTSRNVLLKVTGSHLPTPSRATVSEISKLPENINGAITIDPFFQDLYIINTTLLVPTQNLVKVSTISGDITTDQKPITTDTTRLSSVQFNPYKLKEAMGSANYNSQSGRMAKVEVGSAPWKVEKLGYTPSAYTFVYDFTSSPITAYAGGPSGCRWYDPSTPNPPLGTMYISGSWNKGMVVPYSM
eukprot:m.339045 g.339045  ORF g.339045 m.339045 type:complete len:338 (+) comp18638_c0_seq1:94-1107(+)